MMRLNCLKWKVYLDIIFTSAIFVTLIATNRLGTRMVFVIVTMRSVLTRNQIKTIDIQIYSQFKPMSS